jgi:hypothetical protein
MASLPMSGCNTKVQWPERSYNGVWAIDFQLDQTKDGRMLKVLNVVNEFSRVCQVIRVGRRCRAVDVIGTILELLKLSPPPTHLRMDSGPEFIALALKECCKGSGTGGVHRARFTLGESIRGIL